MEGEREEEEGSEGFVEGRGGVEEEANVLIEDEEDKGNRSDILYIVSVGIEEGEDVEWGEGTREGEHVEGEGEAEAEAEEGEGGEGCIPFMLVRVGLMRKERYTVSPSLPLIMIRAAESWNPREGMGRERGRIHFLLYFVCLASC